MKSMKTMGMYEVVALLITVFWFVGCGASMQRPSSNRPTMTSVPPVNRATTKVLYVTNSAEQRVQRFAINAATRALTAAGDRLGWCCPAVNGKGDRSSAASCEDCAWMVQVLRCETGLLWQYLRSGRSREDEICRSIAVEVSQR